MNKKRQNKIEIVLVLHENNKYYLVNISSCANRDKAKFQEDMSNAFFNELDKIHKCK